MNDTRIRTWDGTETELAAIALLYAAVFSEPPYDEDPETSRTEIIERVRRYAVEKPGFRLLVAVIDDDVVGFVLGTETGPGDWWWGRLDAALTADARKEWLRPHQFSIAELAVDARRRRSGIARSLMEAVLDDLPYDSALLGCHQDADAAQRLYEALGWRVIDPAAQLTPHRRVQVRGIRLDV